MIIKFTTPSLSQLLKCKNSNVFYAFFSYRHNNIIFSCRNVQHYVKRQNDELAVAELN